MVSNLIQSMLLDSKNNEKNFEKLREILKNQSLIKNLLNSSIDIKNNIEISDKNLLFYVFVMKGVLSDTGELIEENLNLYNILENFEMALSNWSKEELSALKEINELYYLL